jgi:hypothetical protein
MSSLPGGFERRMEAAAVRAYIRDQLAELRAEEARELGLRWKTRAEDVINAARAIGPLLANDPGRATTDLILVSERHVVTG